MVKTTLQLMVIVIILFCAKLFSPGQTGLMGLVVKIDLSVPIFMAGKDYYKEARRQDGRKKQVGFIMIDAHRS